MAPEGPRDFSRELYSLGKVLYETATGLGRKKFASRPTDFDQRPDFTTLLKLNEIFPKACKPDPRDCYRTATEMREALEKLTDTRSPRS